MLSPPGTVQLSLDLIVVVVFLLQSESPFLGVLVETKCWICADQIRYGRLQTFQWTFDLHQSLKKLIVRGSVWPVWPRITS